MLPRETLNVAITSNWRMKEHMGGKESEFKEHCLETVTAHGRGRK